MKLKIYVKTLLIITVIFSIIILSVFIAKCFFLTNAQIIFPVQSLVLYWLLICLIVIIIGLIQKCWKEMLLTFVAIGTTLITLEYAIRLIIPYSMMPEAKTISSRIHHHILPSNTTMYQLLHNNVIYFYTNSDGLRSHYSREAFLKHLHRIIVLGDSFIMGPGVRQEATCPEVLEKKLKERCGHDSIAVLNAGIWSYSPFLENILLKEKLIHYQPTLVLLFLDVTDIGDDIIYAAEAQYDGDNRIYFDVPDQRLVHYSALWQVLKPYFQYQWINHYIEVLQYPWRIIVRLFNGNAGASTKKPYDYYRFQVTVDNIVEKNRFFIYRHPLEKTRPFFLKTLENINAIANQVKSIGGDFKLILLPRYHHWSTRECLKNWERGYTGNEPYQYEYFRFFEEVRGKLDYEVINLLPDFQATNKFPLVFPFDPHLNELGHEFLAQCIADRLVFGIQPSSDNNKTNQ